MDKKLNVLFLCTGNSCRSQMAEGLAKNLKSDSYNAYSAGTKPQGINPRAAQVMLEIGIDISKNQSKHILDLNGIDFDIIVSVCDSADQECPIPPNNTKRIQHFFEDPPQLAKDLQSEDQILNCYRKVRDQIRIFIEESPNNF